MTYRMFFNDAGKEVPESAATQVQEIIVGEDGRVVSDAWFKAIAPVVALELEQPELALTPQQS